MASSYHLAEYCPAWSDSLQPHTEQSSRPGPETPSVEADVYIWRYALVVVHARKEEECRRSFVNQLDLDWWRKMELMLRTTIVLRPFFRDHPGELVPEKNFWTLWCKGRLTEADTLTIQLGATPSGLTSVHLHHCPIFLTGRMPFLLPNQQHQSTEGN